MKVIYEDGKPQNIILNNTDLEHIIEDFKNGTCDIRECIQNELFMHGLNGNIKHVWIYYED